MAIPRGVARARVFLDFSGIASACAEGYVFLAGGCGE